MILSSMYSALNQAQAEAATQRIKKILEQPEYDDCLCHHCKESSPATFDVLAVRGIESL